MTSVLQGALAPFAASAALFAGYLVVKFFPNLNLQAFLNLYFWLIGSIAIFGALQSPLRQSVSLLGYPSSPSDLSCVFSAYRRSHSSDDCCLGSDCFASCTWRYVSWGAWVFPSLGVFWAWVFWDWVFLAWVPCEMVIRVQQVMSSHSHSYVTCCWVCDTDMSPFPF